MFNVISRPPLYDMDAVQPMRDELVAVGIAELRTASQVDAALKVNDDKTSLVVINSVCGCAAGGARPGVSLSLQNSMIPDNLYTVFAGQDREATDKVRSMVTNFAPSSPSVALFKNGELVYFLPRYEVEGYSPQQISEKLVNVFNQNCSRKGPSISPEAFAEVKQAVSCGSKIPMYKG